MWLVFGFVVLGSSLLLYVDRRQSFFRRARSCAARGCVARLRLWVIAGGEGGKHRAIPGAVINVQYKIDECICAACVTTQVHECIHRA